MIPEAPVNVEIKEDQLGIERAPRHAIKEAEADDRTLVVSGKMSVISRFREVSDGQVATSVSSVQYKRSGGCCGFASVGSEGQNNMYADSVDSSLLSISCILVCMGRYA